jgi:hypothetical protein
LLKNINCLFFIKIINELSQKKLLNLPLKCHNNQTWWHYPIWNKICSDYNILSKTAKITLLVDQNRESDTLNIHILRYERARDSPISVVSSFVVSLPIL